MDTLKLQAYLDGELSASEAQEITASLTRDEQAQSLFSELKATKTAMTGNELEVRVPESREFYFSKIAREIERQERAEETSAQALPWWRRLAMPLGIAALVVAVAVPVALKFAGPTVTAQQEVDSASTSTFAFYNDDEKPNVTVVWVNPNGTANGN